MVDLPVDDKELMNVLKLKKNLSNELREAISTFLKENLDVFAWKHLDMEGIDPTAMCHRLNLDSDKKSVRQKRRAMEAELYQALKNELDKLIACDFIKESYYPSWLANPILVKKLNGKWRTYVDFTNLNRACPRIAFRFYESISLWTQPQETSCSALWMPTQDTIRSLCTSLIKNTPLSSPTVACTATR